VRLKKQQLGDSVNHNTNTTSSNVINLSNQQLDPPSQRVLDYGLNFAVAPNKIPVKELICDIEAAIRPLPLDTTEMIRQECAVAIRCAKLPIKNISKEEVAALRGLRWNKNITILKVDKGNATVVLNTLDYVEKMMDHLTNNGSYKKLEKDPSNKVIKEVSRVINESSLDEVLKKKLTPKNCLVPRIYGLPKIHKDNIPLRPIVNTIGS
jgi:hypothetical protein